MPKLLSPIHPGEIIREEVLVPLDLSVNQLAKSLAMDAARLNEIVRGRRRGITGRYSPPLGALPWHLARILAEAAGALRTPGGSAGEAEGNRTRSASKDPGGVVLLKGCRA